MAVPVDDLPAPLVARVGRLQVLKATADSAGVREVSKSLRNDLLRGSWPVTRGQYVFYLREAERELPSQASLASENPDHLTRADAVEQLWLKRSTLHASG